MKNIKTLEVKVTYTVGYGDMEMPIEVFNEINQAIENGDIIGEDPLKYNTATDWLINSIQQRDACEWGYEVTEIEEE